MVVVKTFIGNIKGKPGADGKTGAKIVSQELIGEDENGGNIYQQTFDDGTVETFTAPRGVAGKDGKDGTDGTDGADGVGITEITNGNSSQEDGYTLTPITFTLSDGKPKTINVKAKNGSDAQIPDTLVEDVEKNIEAIDNLEQVTVELQRKVQGNTGAIAQLLADKEIKTEQIESLLVATEVNTDKINNAEQMLIGHDAAIAQLNSAVSAIPTYVDNAISEAIGSINTQLAEIVDGEGVE